MNIKPLFGASLLATLVACGSASDPGGFSGTPAPSPSPSPSPAPTPLPSAEGLWTGNTNTGRSVTGIVLEDGTYYFLYSIVNRPLLIGGVVQGTGTSTNGSFTSSDARDFNLEGAGVQSATIDSSYVARQSLNGNVNYTAPRSTVTFTTAFDSDWDTVPTLAAIAGNYTGQVASSQGVENTGVAISSSGVINGLGDSGCTVTGSVTPRSSGNVYAATIVFGPAPCFFANQTLTGIAYYRANLRTLYATAPNADRTDGVLFVGVKP